MASFRPVLCFSLFLFVLVAACGAPTPSPSPPADAIALPAPRRQGEASLEEVLARRRSVRSYTGRELTWEEVGQLLWAAQGVTDPRGLRTAPSAGALYPLEVYVVLGAGWYRYRPADHSLAPLGVGDRREDLWAAGLRQEPLRQAPAVFVLSGVVERSAVKYGGRAQRYVQLEAGHAAQNLLLQATALGLGAVPIGAFDDEQVRAALALSPAETPLYLIPVGEPQSP